jgi:ADP-ribose pyrophosphatase
VSNKTPVPCLSGLSLVWQCGLGALRPQARGCRPDFALIIPYESGAFHLVEQYRYLVKGRYLEFPQGMWEDQQDAAPETVAIGELQEETGLVAGRMTYLGHLFNSPEEGDLVVTRVTNEEFEALVLEGRIKDSSTLSAYSLLQMKRRLP